MCVSSFGRAIAQESVAGFRTRTWLNLRGLWSPASQCVPWILGGYAPKSKLLGSLKIVLEAEAALSENT